MDSASISDDAGFDVAACLARVRQDDPAAAKSLVELLYPLVLKIVRSKLPRRDSEEDLVQEIFVKVFANLDRYAGAVPVEHWVSRIAVNHCLNALRAEKSRPEWRWADLTAEQAEVLDAVMTSGSGEPHPTQAIAARELVDQLLATLDPKDALIIRMLEMEDRSVDEIRQLTGWSSALIRVRAFRARRKLNKLYSTLEKHGGL